MVRSPSLLPLGDCFADRAGLTAHDGRLLMGDSVLVAWPPELLRALHQTLKNECGPVAGTVLHAAGRTYGRSLGQRVSMDLAAHADEALGDLPAAVVQANLASYFARLGWGRVDFDFTRFTEGLVEISVTRGPSIAWSEPAVPAADQLLAGVFAGLFAELSGVELDCLQTDYEVAGTAPARFIIGLSIRLSQVAKLARQGQPHASVVTALESIRV
jgi:predicted hydrocarbon binding protein